MMRNENSVANAMPLYTFSSFRYDASCFVSKNLRRFGNTVPLCHIASAYAARHDLKQYFVICDFWQGHFLDSYVSVIVVHGCKHEFTRKTRGRLCLSSFYLLEQVLGFAGRVVLV